MMKSTKGLCCTRPCMTQRDGDHTGGQLVPSTEWPALTCSMSCRVKYLPGGFSSSQTLAPGRN